MREERARHTHTHCHKRHPLRQWVPRISFAYVCVSFVCAPTSLHFNPINQSGDSFHTSYQLGGHLGGFLQTVFPAVHSRMPIPHIRVVDTLFESFLRGTHSHRFTHSGGYPTQRPPSKDPPRLSCFWRRRLLAFSLFFCRRVLSHRASMLLTLDHWTKIDSTAAAAFQLFLFYPLFHSFPHSLYQFAFTFAHFFIRQSLPPFKTPSSPTRPRYTTLLLALVYSAISAAAPHDDDVDGHLLLPLLVLSWPLKWPKYNSAGTTSSCCTTTSRSIPVSDVP